MDNYEIKTYSTLNDIRKGVEKFTSSFYADDDTAAKCVLGEYVADYVDAFTELLAGESYEFVLTELKYEAAYDTVFYGDEIKRFKVIGTDR